MTPEQKAALDRFRRNDYEEQQASDVIGMALRNQDRCTLAMLALSEHPADDDESVSNEWLKRVGGVKSRADSYTWTFPFDVDGWHRCITVSRDYVRIDGITVIVSPTRGNVRRLCRELGVTLTE